jgi:hypothetical protein
MLRHPYHLVDVSPWPFLAGASLLSFGVNFISATQGINSTISNLGLF